MYDILDDFWYNTPFECIGIVAVRVNRHEPDALIIWKAYICTVSGTNRDNDCQHVAACGSPMAREQAIAFFPWLLAHEYGK